MWIKAITPNDASVVKNNMTPNLTYNSNASNVDTTPNTINQTYGTNVIKINSDGTAERGIQFIFDNLEIGATLEIECEMRVLSGDTPLLKISEWNKGTSVETYPKIKNVVNNGQWKCVKFKELISFLSATYNHRAFVGLPVGSSGIFELRNIRAKANSKQNLVQDKIDRGYYKYIIKKTSGTWALESGANSSGTIETPYSTSIILNHTSQYKPTYQLSSGNANLTLGFTSNQANKLTISGRFIKTDLTVSNSFNDVPDGTEIHVTIFYMTS